MKLSTLIRTMRERNGFSQANLARRIGVGQTAVSQWEGGTKTPRLANLRKLSKVLKTPLQ